MNELPLLLVEVTVVFAAALGVTHLATAAKAAVRHLILVFAVAGALVLPLATLVSPTIVVEIPNLPARNPESIAITAFSMPVGMNPSSTDTVPAAMSISIFPAPALHVPVTTWLLLCWALVALVALLPVGASLWQLRNIRRHARLWSEGTERLARIAPAATTRPPLVLLHEGIAAPVAGGLFNPMIVLPADVVTWSEAHIANALLHELEHVRRHDWAVHLASRGVCAFYWFHPLAWIVWRVLHTEAEQACDDAVLERADPSAYAEQLLALARRLVNKPGLPGLQMASGSTLSTRISAVLDDTRPRGRAGRVMIARVASASVLAVVALAPLRAAGPLRSTVGRNQPAPTVATSAAHTVVESSDRDASPTVEASPRRVIVPQPANKSSVSVRPPQTIAADIVDFADSALADDTLNQLAHNDLVRGRMLFVQRAAQRLVDDDGLDPAAVPATSTALLAALGDAANSASGAASRPGTPLSVTQALEQLEAGLHMKSTELGAAILPLPGVKSIVVSTLERRAAIAALELVQAARPDPLIARPQHVALMAGLDTLERAAQSLLMGDDADHDAAAAKLTALSTAISMTERVAVNISARSVEPAEARRKLADLAGSLRGIEAQLGMATPSPVDTRWVGWKPPDRFAPPSTDATFIRVAQQVSVATLEPNAPNLPLARWLAQLAGVSTSAVHWKINDCGEGGDGREAPICIEARATLAPDTTISISVDVANTEGEPGPPGLFMVYMIKGSRQIPIESLRDLEALVARTRSPASGLPDR